MKKYFFGLVTLMAFGSIFSKKNEKEELMKKVMELMGHYEKLKRERDSRIITQQQYHDIAQGLLAELQILEKKKNEIIYQEQRNSVPSQEFDNIMPKEQHIKYLNPQNSQQPQRQTPITQQRQPSIQSQTPSIQQQPQIQQQTPPVSQNKEQQLNALRSQIQKSQINKNIENETPNLIQPEFYESSGPKIEKIPENEVPFIEESKQPIIENNTKPIIEESNQDSRIDAALKQTAKSGRFLENKTDAEISEYNARLKRLKMITASLGGTPTAYQPSWYRDKEHDYNKLHPGQPYKSYYEPTKQVQQYTQHETQVPIQRQTLSQPNYHPNYPISKPVTQSYKEPPQTQNYPYQRTSPNQNYQTPYQQANTPLTPEQLEYEFAKNETRGPYENAPTPPITPEMKKQVMREIQAPELNPGRKKIQALEKEDKSLIQLEELLMPKLTTLNTMRNPKVEIRRVIKGNDYVNKAKMKEFAKLDNSRKVKELRKLISA